MSRQSTDHRVASDERAKQHKTRQLMRECRLGGKRLPRRFQKALSQIAGRA